MRRFGPNLAQNGHFCTLSVISQNLLEELFSILAYELLVDRSCGSVNAILIESVEVSRFGPTLAQNGHFWTYGAYDYQYLTYY